MATKRQIKANRRNAQKSTGPKTEAGKAASSANALCHGLTAEFLVLLPDEDGDAFERLRGGVIADLAPAGALQEVLAERAAVLLWRLDRVARMEAELFIHGDLALDRTSLVKGYTDAVFPPPFVDQLGEKAKAVRDEFDKRIDLLDASMHAEAPCARVLVQRQSSARAFDQIARHEAMLQRGAPPDAGGVPPACRARRPRNPGRKRRRRPNRSRLRTPLPIPSRRRPAPRRAPAPQGRRPAATKANAEAGSDREKAFLQNEANSAQGVEGTLDSGSDANPSTAPPAA